MRGSGCSRGAATPHHRTEGSNKAPVGQSGHSNFSNHYANTRNVTKVSFAAKSPQPRRDRQAIAHL
jgi:hypothetical protein